MAITEDSQSNGTGTDHTRGSDHEPMTAGRYFATRFSTLKPPMLDVPNPFRLLRMLNAQQWAFFFIAFWAWVCCVLTLDDYPSLIIC